MPSSHPDRRWLLPCLVSLLLFAGCLPASRRTSGADAALAGAPALAVDVGEASYYGNEFEGRQTASGEIFRQSELTAAHRSYPFGTVLRVLNTKNGALAIVRVNDRGPMKPTRIIDLSRRAAEELKMLTDGIATVRIEVLRWGDR